MAAEGGEIPAGSVLIVDDMWVDPAVDVFRDPTGEALVMVTVVGKWNRGRPERVVMALGVDDARNVAASLEAFAGLADQLLARWRTRNGR